MPRNSRIERWRKSRLSKSKRAKLWRMNLEMYGANKLPAKNSKNGSKEVAPVMETPFTYVDRQGIEQTIDLGAVKNLGDTDWAESQKLFPNATQCMVEQSGIKFDAEGRQNILNDNICVLSAVRMTKGEYGPWFLLQAAHPDLGEISVPAPGQVSNEAIEQISGIALKDRPAFQDTPAVKAGDRFGPSEFPVWCRFEFVPGKGAFGNGYFVVLPAMQQADAEEIVSGH